MFLKLLCLAALPAGGPDWSPAADVAVPAFDQTTSVVAPTVRGQSPYGSPYYGGEPAPSGPPRYVPAQYSPAPYTPADPFGGTSGPPPVFNPPPATRPPVTPGFGGVPSGAPVLDSYGVNGAEPFRPGARLLFDAGFLTDASTSGPRGSLAVTELDTGLEFVSVLPGRSVFTTTFEFDQRLLDGPSTPPGLPEIPGDLYRLAADFELASPRVGPFSTRLAFTPAIATDFERGLDSGGVQFDGRAAVLYDLTPNLTLVAGAQYYDRLDDRVLPHGGLVLRRGDRWEYRLTFPEARVSYFYGKVWWGKPMWVHAGYEFNYESFQLGDRRFGAGDQIQFKDHRFLLGARKEQGWGETFLETGLVFGREIEFAGPAADVDVNEALLLRGGIRF